MLDELLEVFDRDRKKNPNAPKQKGLRGLISRLREDDHDDRRYARPEDRPYRDRDDDDRRYVASDRPVREEDRRSYAEPSERRYRDDDDDDDRSYDSRGKRKREREGFDFFDD